VIFKEGRFGYFNPLIIELNGSIQWAGREISAFDWGLSPSLIHS
jgi:hypothetical protein